jgi:hypothetical protein
MIVAAAAEEEEEAGAWQQRVGLRTVICAHWRHKRWSMSGYGSRPRGRLKRNDGGGQRRAG